jgi:Ca-activated chloride channel family protein
MTLLWPEMLWLLLLVPAVVAAYLLLLRFRKRGALRYASLTVMKDAMGASRGLRRHVPPLLFLAAFVAEQPKSARIGVVSFAATASVVQSPTHSREDILAAIDRFQLQRGTAVGSGILVALKMIFPDAEFDLRASNPRRDAARASPLGPARPADKPETKPVPPGSYSSAAIIMLTDGQTTTGPDPIESARIAADRGVRVYTVGIGTPGGETIGAEGWSMRVRLDEQSLKTIATLTQGEYFYAGTAPDLQKIYENLNTKLFFEQKETEISALFAAAAAVLALVSALLSLLWFNRIL